MMTDPCLICGKPMPDYEPEYCCHRRDCACHGMPINPRVCGPACCAALFENIGCDFDERRKRAGIELWWDGTTEGNTA